MKIETNSVHIRYRELFDLLHQTDRDLFREVLGDPHRGGRRVL